MGMMIAAPRVSEKLPTHRHLPPKKTILNDNLFYLVSLYCSQTLSVWGNLFAMHFHVAWFEMSHKKFAWESVNAEGV